MKAFGTFYYSTSRFLVSHARKGRKVPPVVLLVGNKADLSCSPGERMVSAVEGQKRAKEIEAHAFHEISVRESIDQVTIRNVLDQFDDVK